MSAGTPSPPVEHPYYTRSATPAAELQIVAVTSLCEGQTLAAGSATAQETFLQGVGIITTDIEPLEEILSSDAAELLSCALNHRRRADKTRKVTDPYFTVEEWERVLDNCTDLVEDADKLLEGSTHSIDGAQDWKERKRSIPHVQLQSAHVP